MPTFQRGVLLRVNSFDYFHYHIIQATLCYSETMRNFEPTPTRDALVPVDQLGSLSWQERIRALERYIWRFVTMINEWDILAMDNATVLTWSETIRLVWVSRNSRRR